MRRTFAILFVSIFCCASILAQQKLTFSVLDFERDVYDLSGKSSEYGKKDGNGSWYAIIKVTSNNPDDDITACQFNFGNMSSKVEKHDEALWVYVQRNAKTVTITRSGYHTIDKYDLQTTIEAGAVYNMVLKGAVTHQKLHIKCTPSDAVVLIDGEVVEENPITLQLGTYKYTAAANGYISQSGSIELKENAPAKLIIELDKKEQNHSTVQSSSQEILKENEKENGHEYVDLGLPSGLLWAKCNVGAASETAYGDYYAWGETTKKSTY